MENTSKSFVRRLHCMAYGELPERVMDKVRECLKDYISCVYGGCKIYADLNRKFISQNKMSGDIHIFGMEETTDLRTAVMINAFNSHVLEMDDSHRSAMTHLGAPIFSALIGVGELYGCTLGDVLKATAVGYEASIRLANAIQPSHKKRGFHVSGTCCTIGCAMGIAAMLGYSQEEMDNVFSASVTSAAGLLAVISGKSEQKPYNIANAAVAGVNAALYGKYFIGAVDVLGDSRGFFHAMTDLVKTDKLFEEGYAIEGIYQKLYAACRHCHAPMEATLNIREKIDISDIERIDVRTYDLAVGGHDHTNITCMSSAKQSIPYGVAVAALYGNCGLKAFTQETIKDKKLLSLCSKVKVINDKELTALVPGKRAAIVEVTHHSGKKIVSRVDYAKGEPENPITKREWSEKFAELMQSVGIGEKKIKGFYRFIEEGENKPIDQMFNILG